ncbi:hypothetical protein THRCLA_21385 [Thraustotheca clavata]|uniref:Uncharacterized protein n=1 Tax=Thraustotheca clavata TaxID=74557 RepID=A0A1V9ZX33_9STRA|nr:hypothetical protein THRCLA_21385 [Thraustotheca clavata]
MGNSKEKKCQIYKPLIILNKKLSLQYVVPSGPARQDHFIKQSRHIKRFKMEYPHPLFLLYGPRHFGKTTIAIDILEWIRNKPNIKAIYIELRKSDVANENQLVKEYTEKDKVQLCLIVDEFDIIFSNQELAKYYFLTLRQWRLQPYFRGFLGVGSHQLPFTLNQMRDFFKLIESRYAFTKSLQSEIINVFMWCTCRTK